MKKVQVKKIIFLMLSALLLMGCKKNDGPVIDPNMEQPVLGDDAEGYGGFTYLQAYSFGEEGGNSVLYLPKDENAYVGKTTMICKTEGVEVTVNYNPEFSADEAKKSVAKKLQSTVDSEFSDIYTENFVDLLKSDVAEAGENVAIANVSYLVYDEATKTYVSNWVEYCHIKLEDEREFRITLRVDSNAATERSALVFEELETYLNVDFSYDSEVLQTKIDGYELNDTDIAKMSGENYSFDCYNLYLPEGWQENTQLDMISELVDENNLIEQVSYYTRNGDFDASEPEVIVMFKTKTDYSSGELGAFSKGELQIFEDYLMKDTSIFIGADVKEIDIIGETDLGFVIKMEVENMAECDGSVYYIYKGYDMYALCGLTENGETGEDPVYEIVDQIYENMEMR